MSAVESLAPRVEASLHARFLELMPRIETHARIVFRDVRCADSREDKIAETLALGWRWFVRLTRRGKDVGRFVSTFAALAARAVKSGRRLCGQEKAKEVLSPLAQRKHSFAVRSLPEGRSLAGNIINEALHDNVHTPPPEAAAFRVDFPAWLKAWTQRDRRLICDLMIGERARQVAKKYHLTEGRVSQLRRQFQQDWQAYCGDDEAVLCKEVAR